MTSSVRMQWHGDRCEAIIHGATGDGLQLAAEHLLAEANKIVPIEEHILEASGHPDIDRQALEASVSYDTPYAVVQHERLDYRHDPGRQAKYLETPFNTEAATLQALVALPIRKALGK